MNISDLAEDASSSKPCPQKFVQYTRRVRKVKMLGLKHVQYFEFTKATL